MRLFSGWRPERVEVVSPLPAPEAVRCLALAVTSWRDGLFGTRPGQPRLVLGRVTSHWLILSAPRPGVRNAWSPVLQGQVVPEGTGSRFVGRIGWHPLARAFTVAALVVSAAMVAVIETQVVWPDVGHHPSTAAAVGVLGLAAFWLALPAFASRIGVADGDYLRRWVATVLEEAAPAGSSR